MSDTQDAGDTAPEVDNTQEEADIQQTEEAVAEIQKEAEIEVVQLTLEIIQPNISLLSRTGSGLEHAFTRLEVHQHPITHVDLIASYPHLRFVDMSENALVDVQCLSQLEYLLAVNLSSNHLKSIECFDQKKYLQHLNVSKNALTSVGISSLPSLSWLNLNGNFYFLQRKCVCKSRSSRLSRIIASRSSRK